MKERVVVAVDAMGGDHAPAVEIEAAIQAARRWDIAIALVGDQERINDELNKHNVAGLDLRVRHASQVVGMQDSASDAVRKKKDSSIRVAFNMVKEGDAHAVVSAGNSGATMAAGMFVLKRVRGIDRPAIATIMPNLRDQTLVLDVGGNVDCKPLHLAQFAAMGDVYARHILGKKNPRVGLLSNGEEEKKGTELTRETHGILKSSHFNYVGYVEGRDIFNGTVDVVVCDGFVGNVVLKVSEGVADAMTTMLRREFDGRLLAKLGFLLAKPAFRAFKKKIDYAEYGGAPLLGIEGVGMICHGGSSAQAIMNAIRMARDYSAMDVNRKLTAYLEKIGEPPAGEGNASEVAGGNSAG
ncbi:phosphate:acyl-[acyl carrier protein] acyltransferase [Geoalkalibacter ferrihydriticus]|uniref:Phosphate acyltransferase n=1 Tax=Geoalkalibacter ferrihydriticus TaxID=392333 RepID=A0A1G9R2C8_9BACT|nr:phosphate acyltransferase PlsX [Geoalkalibacter ferrihydriticus]SDM17452.1 phosphate:acyl-[acyl carrier protein] acyltransferase [Geoalkalibacter ferrihydriticus]